MKEIELRGLHDDHPAGALAAYGLLALLPECKLSFRFHADKFERGLQYYYAVLHGSPFDTIEQLASFLADPKTWGFDNFGVVDAGANFWQIRIALPVEKPVMHEGKCVVPAEKKNRNKIPLRQYNLLASQGLTSWLSAIGTDHVMAKVNDDESKKSKGKKSKKSKGKNDKAEPTLSAESTPFYPNCRKENLVTKIERFLTMFCHTSEVISEKAIKKLTETQKRQRQELHIAETLRNHHWVYQHGDGISLFPELPLDSVFQTKAGSETVPILCLLAIMNWKNCPVFSQGKKSMAPMFFRDGDEEGQPLSILLPTFTKPVSRQALASWLLNGDIYEPGNKNLGNVGIARINRFPYHYHNTRTEIKSSSWPTCF